MVQDGRQQLLNAELEHRLHNVFGLIASIITRSAEGKEDAIQHHSTALLGRLEALSRTTGLLTDTPTGPVSLRSLIEIELAPFEGLGTRLLYHGDAPLLRPAACTSLALLVHELVTNSVKHGALGNTHGGVELRFTSDPPAFTWKEHGGPADPFPRHAGFGSLLLTQVLADLPGGEARIQFLPEGLLGQFTLPQAFIHRATPVGDQPSQQPTGNAPAIPAPSGGQDVLIVEDNLLMAMQTKDILRDLGLRGETLIALTVSDALAELAQRPFQIAILDCDIAGESSAPVATALREAGTGFLITSGYDRTTFDHPAFQGAPRLCKPYRIEALAAAIMQLGLPEAVPHQGF